MTNEEAKRTLTGLIGYLQITESLDEPTYKALNMAIDALENQPKHGHWIHTGRTNVLGGHQHKCSVCSYALMVSNMCDNENYCCNCGSKMDEEVER